MKRSIACLTLVSCLFAGMMVLPVQAELGLQQENPKAAGAAVKSAVEAIHNSSDDATSKHAQIVAILNEAAATGDEAVIRYALVAVLLAGGEENMDLSEAAVNNSNIASDYPELVSQIIPLAKSLIVSGANATPIDEDAGGGDDAGGGGDSGGGDDLGGGSDFDFIFSEYGRIMDQDSEATDT